MWSQENPVSPPAGTSIQQPSLCLVSTALSKAWRRGCGRTESCTLWRWALSFSVHSDASLQSCQIYQASQVPVFYDCPPRPHDSLQSFSTDRWGNSLEKSIYLLKKNGFRFHFISSRVYLQEIETTQTILSERGFRQEIMGLQFYWKGWRSRRGPGLLERCPEQCLGTSRPSAAASTLPVRWG